MEYARCTRVNHLSLNVQYLFKYLYDGNLYTCTPDNSPTPTLTLTLANPNTDSSPK